MNSRLKRGSLNLGGSLQTHACLLYPSVSPSRWFNPKQESRQVVVFFSPKETNLGVDINVDNNDVSHLKMFTAAFYVNPEIGFNPA